jgi:hypothetical protein
MSGPLGASQITRKSYQSIAFCLCCDQLTIADDDAAATATADFFGIIGHWLIVSW